MYVYQAGEDTTRNQAVGKRIVYRVGTTKGDISGDHKDYRVTATEKVNGTKVTLKGGEKMVYLAGWTKMVKTIPSILNVLSIAIWQKRSLLIQLHQNHI